MLAGNGTYILAGAMIAAFTSVLVNVVYNWFRAKRDENAAVNLAKYKADLDKEIWGLKAKLDREASEAQEEAKRARELAVMELQQKHALEFEKYKRRLDDRARIRAEREKLINELLELLPKITEEFLEATQLSPSDSEDKVIKQAHTVYALYGRFRYLLTQFRGRIRRAHYGQLVELRSVLVRVCLDMALEPSEREEPSRQQRLQHYRERLNSFSKQAEEILEDALVPWEEEAASVETGSSASDGARKSPPAAKEGGGDALKALGSVPAAPSAAFTASDA